MPYIKTNRPWQLQNCGIIMSYMKNSCVEWDKVSHAFGGLSRQLISITLSPRILGSVKTNPRGWYTVSFCSATNFDTFFKHYNKINNKHFVEHIRGQFYNAGIIQGVYFFSASQDISVNTTFTINLIPKMVWNLWATK